MAGWEGWFDGVLFGSFGHSAGFVCIPLSWWSAVPISFLRHQQTSQAALSSDATRNLSGGLLLPLQLLHASSNKCTKSYLVGGLKPFQNYVPSAGMVFPKGWKHQPANHTNLGQQNPEVFLYVSTEHMPILIIWHIPAYTTTTYKSHTNHQS